MTTDNVLRPPTPPPLTTSVAYIKEVKKDDPMIIGEAIALQGALAAYTSGEYAFNT
jgi:hypothetical protein